MIHESNSAKWIRGIVKLVFILCYIAFMWASIHHVATYFDSFEANGGDQAGSYMLAGAFDITALVTTIGVMFFRKSMPGYVQWIVWLFIIAIAGYSFFINWEYAAHFQNTSLALQPTGETTPAYDAQGNLHYVPVMQQNTALIFVNPFLASGFTIFSLIYSVVAEFFGTKPPTIQELNERKQYLKETQSVLESIKELEEKRKGKGVIAVVKEKAIEGQKAWEEIKKRQVTDALPAGSTEVKDTPNDQLPGGLANEAWEDDAAVTSGVSGPVIPSVAPDLDFIEQMMYNRLVGQPDALQELRLIAAQTDLTGLILYLQKRFSGYSTYFTEERVKHVMEAIQCDPAFDEEVHVSKHRTDPLTAAQEGSVANEIEEVLTEVVAVSSEGLGERAKGREVNGGNDHNQKDGGTDQVRQMEPETEAMNVTNFPGNGSITEVIDVAKRRKPFSVAEAAQVLECTEKTVREMRKRGTLEHVEGDDKFLLAASVRRVWNERQKNKKAV